MARRSLLPACTRESPIFSQSALKCTAGSSSHDSSCSKGETSMSACVVLRRDSSVITATCFDTTSECDLKAG